MKPPAYFPLHDAASDLKVPTSYLLSKGIAGHLKIFVRLPPPKSTQHWLGESGGMQKIYEADGEPYDEIKIAQNSSTLDTPLHLSENLLLAIAQEGRAELREISYATKRYISVMPDCLGEYPWVSMDHLLILESDVANLRTHSMAPSPTSPPKPKNFDIRTRNSSLRIIRGLAKYYCTSNKESTKEWTAHIEAALKKSGIFTIPATYPVINYISEDRPLPNTPAPYLHLISALAVAITGHNLEHPYSVAVALDISFQHKGIDLPVKPRRIGDYIQGHKKHLLSK